MLKPLDFMEPIQGIEVEEDLYSWEDQSRLTKNEQMATTFRATQTYDSKGNPKDNDND